MKSKLSTQKQKYNKRKRELVNPDVHRTLIAAMLLKLV